MKPIISGQNFSLKDYLDFLIEYEIKFVPSRLGYRSRRHVFFQLVNWFGDPGQPNTIRLCLRRTVVNDILGEVYTRADSVNADYGFLRSIDCLPETTVQRAAVAAPT